LPPSIIGPEDVIAEGMRPEAPPRASRGNTPEPGRVPAPAPVAPSPVPSPPPLPQEPTRLPTPEVPPALAASRPGPILPDVPAGDSRNGVPQIGRESNMDALLLPRLSSGRAGNVVDNATAGIGSRMAQQPQIDRTVGGGSAGRTGVDRGQELPNFNTDDPQILSDTRGYDFGPYLNQIVNRVRLNWYSLIPESVRYSGQRGTVVLTFVIVKSGASQQLTLHSSSGRDPLDRAAMGSITASNPFPPLPVGFSGDYLKLQFTYLYNVPRP
jgi:TonB family protein